MLGCASTKHWASCPSANVCKRIGSTRRSSPGVGTYQTCLWGDATTNMDPSARAARFSSMWCSGKFATVVSFARVAVVIIALLYLGPTQCFRSVSPLFLVDAEFGWNCSAPCLAGVNRTITDVAVVIVLYGAPSIRW